jgi:PKD repeat protein
VEFKGDATYDGSLFSKTFTVFDNQPPVIADLADPGKHVWGVPIEFSGFATDPDGSPQDTLRYVWDFGDGTSAINNKVSHAYDKPGEYGVTLTVTDKDGAVSEVRTTVTINKRDTALKNCGDIQVPNGQRTVNDCARLIDSEGDKVVGETIVFTMTIAGTPITNSGLTDANGELRTAFNRNMPAGCFAANIVYSADGGTDNRYNPSRYDYFFYTSGNGGPQNCSFSPAGTSGYDVNCDGSANSVDALYILQVVAGLTSFVSCSNVANVNGDDVVDPLDALVLLQYAAGILN